MLGLCSIAFAEELDPRWKWYSSTSYESEYFDTNTIEYDADSQIARVWTLNLNAEGRKNQAIKIQISYVTKKKKPTSKCNLWFKQDLIASFYEHCLDSHSARISR